MNAEYKKVHVNMVQYGQQRTLVLHVVKQENKPNLYFLFDFYGWAIDEVALVEAAAHLFESGKYTEVIN